MNLEGTQLAIVVSKLERKRKLASQPKYANVSAIMLRSGKVLPSTTQEPNVDTDPLSSKIQNEAKNDERNKTQDQPSNQ